MGATKSNKASRLSWKYKRAIINEGRRADYFYNKAGRYPKEKDNHSYFLKSNASMLQTKDILYPDTRAILLPEWKEIDFGRFEGKNYQDLNGDPDYQRWIDSGGVTAFLVEKA